jgi:hypothetical protein
MEQPTRRDIRSAILAVLRAESGAAETETVYRLLRGHFSRVPHEVFEARNERGVSTWKHKVRMARQDLVRKGWVESRGRAVWALTRSGEEEASRQ